MYVHLGRLSPSDGKSDEVGDYFEKARSISNQIGHRFIEFESLLCITQLKVQQSKIEEAM